MASKFRFFILLSFIFFLCSSGSFISDVKVDSRQKLANKRRNSGRRELMETTQDAFSINTNYPATPVTNPVTTPGAGSTTPPDNPPPIISVPPAVTNPVTTPGAGSTTPPDNPPPIFSVPPAVTNPVTTPGPGSTTPAVTNPVTTPGAGSTTPPDNPPPIVSVPPGVTNPVTTPAAGSATPPVITVPPAVGNGGQSWCVARGGMSESVIQVALDYACGIGGVDCSAIQQGQSCYNPNTLENHASYAFNSYFQNNPLPTSCDFGGAATITNANPSSGSCIFPTSSSSPATNPIPTPAADGAAPIESSSSGSPPTPTMMNASNPALGSGGGFGEIIPPSTTDAALPASSSSVKPFTTCSITLLLSIIIYTNFNFLCRSF